MSDFGLSVGALEQALARRREISLPQLPEVPTAAGVSFDELPQMGAGNPFFRAQQEKQARGSRNPFIMMLDLIASPGYAVAGLVKGIVDVAEGETGALTPLENMLGGLTVWASGNPAQRHSFTEVLEDVGWETDTTAGKVARGVLGFALDVALDPLTYVGLGVAKHALRAGSLGVAKKITGETAEAIAKRWGNVSGLALTGRGAKINAKAYAAFAKRVGAQAGKKPDIGLLTQFNEALTPLVVGPLGRQAEQLIAKEGLPAFMRAKGLSMELLQDFAGVTGRSVDDIAAWGLLPYMDKGGLKLFGRTLIRSQIANRMGLAYDTAISKWLIDPAARAVRTAGKIPILGGLGRAAAGAARKFGTGLKRTVGEFFNYELLTDDLVFREMYRKYARGASIVSDDVARGLKDAMHSVPDGKGGTRLITEDETRKLHQVMHDRAYLLNREEPDIAAAEALLKGLPEELRPVHDRIRGLLDEVNELDEAHGILHATREEYIPQMWEEDAWKHIQSLPPDKQKIGRFDWWSKGRVVELPFEDAIKAGLKDDFWGNAYHRLMASRRLALMQGFVQDFVETYGTRLIKVGRRNPDFFVKEGPFSWLLDDYVRLIDDVPVDAAGRPVTRSAQIQKALDYVNPARTESPLRYEDAMRSLRRAKPIMPERTIDEVTGTIGGRMDEEIEALSKSLSDRTDTHLKRPDPLYLKMQARREYLRQLRPQVDELNEVLKTRSLERKLSGKLRKGPEVPASAWTASEVELREAARVLKEGRLTELTARLQAYRNRWTQVTAGGGATPEVALPIQAQIKKIEREIDELAQVSFAKPDVQTRGGTPKANAAAVEKYVADLEALGIDSRLARQSGARIRTAADMASAIDRRYRTAAGRFHKWQKGWISSDDPTKKLAMNSDFDDMERVAGNVEQLAIAAGRNDEALAEAVREMGRAIERNAATYGAKPVPKELAAEVTMLFKQQQVYRQALGDLRRNVLTPGEIRKARAIFNSPELAAKREALALQNPSTIADNVLASGEIETLPVMPGQRKAILEVLNSDPVLAKKTEDLLVRITGKRRIEDMTFEEARQFLEIARRRPAKLREGLGSVRYGNVPTDPVTLPGMAGIRVKWEGEWISPSDVAIPRADAEVLKQMMKETIPGPRVANLLKGYDTMHDLFRWSVTMPWLAFHVRNAFDANLRAFAEMGLSAMRPKYMNEFIKTMAGSTAPIALDWGGVVTRETIKEALQQRGLWREFPVWSDLRWGKPQEIYRKVSEFLSGSLKGTKQAEGYKLLNGYRIQEAFEKTLPGKGLGKYFNWSKDVENASMFTYLLQRLDKGIPLEKALDEAETVFFSFAARTDIEKVWMRRIFPFYNFLRSAAPYTIHVAKDHPWVMTSLAHLRNFGGERAELEPYLPQFVKDSFSVQIPTEPGQSPRFWVMNNFVTVDWARDWAMSDTHTFMRSILGSLSPLITYPIEFGLRKDFYFGGDIRDRKVLRRTMGDARLNPFLKWLNAREVQIGGDRRLAVDGLKLHALRTFFLGRLYSSLDTISRKDLVAQDKLLRLGAGVISTEIDLQHQQTMMMERAQKLQSSFYRALRQGDDVQAGRILEELKGNMP